MAYLWHLRKCLVFEARELKSTENWTARKKTSRNDEMTKTNIKLNPHMMQSSLGIEPGSHWWMTSAQ